MFSYSWRLVDQIQLGGENSYFQKSTECLVSQRTVGDLKVGKPQASLSIPAREWPKKKVASTNLLAAPEATSSSWENPANFSAKIIHNCDKQQGEKQVLLLSHDIVK